jgi:hypothetical protein
VLVHLFAEGFADVLRSTQPGSAATSVQRAELDYIRWSQQNP